MPSSACDWSSDVDRKSTRLNSSHDQISYAVFCLKKKNRPPEPPRGILPPLTVLVLAMLGPDRTRLVERVAGWIAAQGGNWLECFFLMIRGPPRSTLSPYTPLFR